MRIVTKHFEQYGGRLVRRSLDVMNPKSILFASEEKARVFFLACCFMLAGYKPLRHDRHLQSYWHMDTHYIGTISNPVPAKLVNWGKKAGR